MKYAQTTVEFLLITLTAVILGVIIADRLGLVNYAKKTIFVNTKEGEAIEVPSMVH